MYNNAHHSELNNGVAELLGQNRKIRSSADTYLQDNKIAI